LRYEIAGPGKAKTGPNRVNRNRGWAADSGAGLLGGEIVGETRKTDSEINSFIEDWLRRNKTYDVLIDNCQKFAYEFVYFLTDGTNFRLPHRFDAAVSVQGLAVNGDAFALCKDGTAIARAGTGETRASFGWYNSMYRGPSAEASAVAGGGFGAWANVSPVGRAEVNLGPVFGMHVEPNINTGLGVRDGNLDVHFLGTGFRIGADGLEINTPLYGVNLCTIP
jgi:hypothetical protein